MSNKKNKKCASRFRWDNCSLSIIKQEVLICIFISITHTAIAENITTDTIWTLARSPYTITETVLVEFDATLTIEAGVQVFFNDGTRFLIQGRLLAQGTNSQHILFTSSNPSPYSGVWAGIFFCGSDPGTVMEYCDISYGGDNESQSFNWKRHDGNITLFDCYDRITLSYCTLSNSENDGICISQNSSPIISNCTFSNNNRYGINCDQKTADPQIEDCSLINNGSYAISLYANSITNIIDSMTINGNTENSIRVISEDIETGRWRDHGVAYTVMSISVPDAQTLTLDPGVELRFNDLSGFCIAGKLIAQGTSSEHIIITSSNPTPSPGIWAGIFFCGSDPGTVMEYCDISYGGD
ncbi:right-handed parallel beta-helix repeat-containing protein, partial [bacterium]|nr:right-handed parallel beta-helix repeat-containing protein [bacterium]